MTRAAGATALLLLSLPSSARAQAAGDSARAHPPSCDPDQVGGGADCPPGRRLAVDLRYAGPAGSAADAWRVVDMAAGRAGVQALRLDRAAATDSALHAVVEVVAVGGGYHVSTRLAGARAPAGACARPRTIVVGAELPERSPMLFGALLAAAVERLVRCARGVRGDLPQRAPANGMLQPTSGPWKLASLSSARRSASH